MSLLSFYHMQLSWNFNMLGVRPCCSHNPWLQWTGHRNGPFLYCSKVRHQHNKITIRNKLRRDVWSNQKKWKNDNLSSQMQLFEKWLLICKQQATDTACVVHSTVLTKQDRKTYRDAPASKKLTFGFLQFFSIQLPSCQSGCVHFWSLHTHGCL